MRQLTQTFDQELLHPVLLQVDERRAPMPGLGQEIKVEHLLVAEKYAADVPFHAFFHKTFAAAETIENL